MSKPTVKNKRTLSFRAECEHDVRLLFEAILAEGYTLKRSIGRSQIFPEVRVEITTSANFEEIMGLMRTIPDSHVMMQTLRTVPLSENSLEREFPVYRSAREYSIHSAQRLGGGESASRLQAC